MPGKPQGLPTDGACGLSMAGELDMWVKAFHIVAVIAWMAGLLYLPRLFVYHCRAEQGSVQSETFKMMERKLLRQIMTPAMVVSITLGVWLLAVPGVVDWSEGWIYLKLAFVIVLLVNHGLMARFARGFAEDRNQKSEKFYRVFNEAPMLAMIAIVILVVVKPF